MWYKIILQPCDTEPWQPQKIKWHLWLTSSEAPTDFQSPANVAATWLFLTVCRTPPRRRSCSPATHAHARTTTPSSGTSSDPFWIPSMGKKQTQRKETKHKSNARESSPYWRNTAHTLSFGSACFAKKNNTKKNQAKKERQPATGSRGRRGRGGGASHRFCELIILETKLTMAVAGCSGSSSAKRWLTLSVVLPCLRATKPKSLERKRQRVFSLDYL